MTEEQADQVFELACEKYIEESRALDRHNFDKSQKLIHKFDVFDDGSLYKSRSDETNPIKKIKYKYKSKKFDSTDKTYRQPAKSHGEIVGLGAVGIDMYNRFEGGKKNSKAGKVTKDGKKMDIIDVRDKKTGKYKRYDMTPAEEKKAGKYLDMYNKKKAEKK